MKKSAFLLTALGLTGVLASCSGNGASSSSSGSYNPTVTSTLPTYTVTLNLCGGANLAVTSYSVRSGETFSPPGVKPYREGYSFSEWCAEYDEQTEMGKEGTGVSFPLTITGNTVLYARYISTSGAEHTQEEVEAYMEGLSESSEDNHLYLHYYRYGNEPSSYDDWDVWAWPYKPKAAEGHKFDFAGKESGGQAEVDEFGGAFRITPCKIRGSIAVLHFRVVRDNAYFEFTYGIRFTLIGGQSVIGFAFCKSRSRGIIARVFEFSVGRYVKRDI